MFRIRVLFFLLLYFLLEACTTVGFHRESIRAGEDFGKLQTIRVCVWKDENVSSERVSSLIDAWNDELALYKLKANVSQIKVWNRPGWTGFAILAELYKAPLPENCDRILAFAGVRITDFFYQIAQIILAFFFIPVPEVLGAVDGYTGTRGYILAHTFSINQLFWSSPSATIVHEGYHLLGCGHALFLSKCYMKIKELKDSSLLEAAQTDHFFPATNPKGGYFLERKDVNFFFLGE
ncbi:hypothetical protein LEP1GSC058_2422 [Leptospira fainei serovar Hurstbridge str. BUT 6]|uniref:Uncharacterized protein n=1 Tax=Leptospira fainei serovar Hurstbridge str. BUT 6 TaxID=1193011 RepID=S3V0K6_9LEPT|nr:hypothetical protein [Leptospira fainei]EPG74129.1 hypothetical protein LEP1GSC058_2422 [Leptospira fainei serovar Hurstbridge str. BUT 6]